jgi:hypothetical protein
MVWVGRDDDPADTREMWENDVYAAALRRRADGLECITVNRHDLGAVRDWRHLQQIKNEMCGAEREGCEVFPAESRLMDWANQAHIWVLPEGERFPFGVEHRDVRAGGAVQREWQAGLTTGGGAV